MYGACHHISRFYRFTQNLLSSYGWKGRVFQMFKNKGSDLKRKKFPIYRKFCKIRISTPLGGHFSVKKPLTFADYNILLLIIQIIYGTFYLDPNIKSPRSVIGIIYSSCLIHILHKKSKTLLYISAKL